MTRRPDRPRPTWQVPTPTDELLIVAATGTDAVAQPAWSRWLAETRFDDVSPSALHVLPLVRANLSDCCVGNDAVGRLRGIERRAWVESQRLRHGAGSMVAALDAAGIPTCFVGDAALAQLYVEPTRRAIGSIELLVAGDCAEDAWRAITAAGWRPDATATLRAAGGVPTRAYRRLRSGITVTHPSGAAAELRWHAFDDCRWDTADDGLWARSLPAGEGPRDSMTTRRLDPTDAALAAIVRGVRGHDGETHRAIWVVDAVIIARTTGLDVDTLWQRAIDLRVEPPVHAALTYLASQHAEYAGPRSAPAPFRRIDRAAFAGLGCGRASLGPLNRIAVDVGRYARSARGRSARTTATEIGSDLRIAIGSDRARAVPRALARRLTARLDATKEQRT